MEFNRWKNGVQVLDVVCVNMLGVLCFAETECVVFFPGQLGQYVGERALVCACVVCVRCGVRAWLSTFAFTFDLVW